MPVTSGVFGKEELQAGALTKIWYNSSASAATANVVFCNRSSTTAAKIRIAIIPASTAGVSLKDFIVYDQPLPPNSTFETMGLVMGTQETIYCYSSISTVTVRVHGFVDDRGAAVSDIGNATYVNYGLTVYAQGLDIISTDKAATPALVKAIVDAYGGGTGGGGSSSGGSSSGGSSSGGTTGSGTTQTGAGSFGAKMTSIWTAKTPANYDMSVPLYRVGKNAINVWIDGILAMGGDDSKTYAYNEIGSAGTTSTVIKLFDSYDVGTQIVVIA